jgi:hypothetical protein
MAIKIGGTTVIDDSRNISNIAGGLKTINSTSILGSGNIEAGASTTFGDVGTYGLLNRGTTNLIASAGATIAGSNLNRRHAVYNWIWQDSTAVSGTWRCMGYNNATNAGTLWVRIS